MYILPLLLLCVVAASQKQQEDKKKRIQLDAVALQLLKANKVIK